MEQRALLLSIASRSKRQSSIALCCILGDFRRLRSECPLEPSICILTAPSGARDRLDLDGLSSSRSREIKVGRTRQKTRSHLPHEITYAISDYLRMLTTFLSSRQTPNVDLYRRQGPLPQQASGSRDVLLAVLFEVPVMHELRYPRGTQSICRATLMNPRLHVMDRLTLRRSCLGQTNGANDKCRRFQAKPVHRHPLCSLLDAAPILLEEDPNSKPDAGHSLSVWPKASTGSASKPPDPFSTSTSNQGFYMKCSPRSA